MTDWLMHLSLVIFLTFHTFLGIKASEKAPAAIVLSLWSVTLLIWEASRWLR